MIVTNQTTDTKQNFNATSTRNRIMASTMSVDEYFDELIDKVREDYLVIEAGRESGCQNRRNPLNNQ